jgi:hypothetical protein
MNRFEAANNTTVNTNGEPSVVMMPSRPQKSAL